MIGPGNTNDDDDDDDSGDQYGTMIVAKKGNNNDSDDDKDIDNDSQYNSDNDNQIQEWESVFKNNEYINQELPIPDDVTKDELMEIWKRIKQVSKEDKQIFEEFYKKQINIVEQKLAAL